MLQVLILITLEVPKVAYNLLFTHVSHCYLEKFTLAQTHSCLESLFQVHIIFHLA